MKIEKYFKPPSYQFVVHESANRIQQKLQTLFDRNYGRIMFDIRYNIHGTFTNSERSTFKILQAGGTNTSGISPSFNGKIAFMDEQKTAITLTPTLYVSDTVSWLLSLFVGILLVSFIVTFSKSLGTETIFTGVGVSTGLFIIIKIRQLLNAGLIEDFEKVLQGVKD